tara:strand:- start:106 stop:597 length:492 start_codon:yes stop_codon:yes gene_type:complete
MNKRGQTIMAKEIPKILFYILFLVIISFVLIFNVGLFSSTKIMSGALHNHIPVAMLWTSSDCLAYSEEGRVFLGIIDLEKFNEERLEKCFDSNRQGVELTFISFDENLDIKVELNKEMVSRGILCDMKKSELDCYKTKKYVLYNSGDSFRKGSLNFKVVTPRE